jgi:hypothetical protein
MRNSSGGAGAEEGVEDEVVCIRGDLQNPLDQTLGFGG